MENMLLNANGELKASRKDKHTNVKNPKAKTKEVPTAKVVTTVMEVTNTADYNSLTTRTARREYLENSKNNNSFNIFNAMSLEGAIKHIKANWDEYKLTIRQLVKKTAVKAVIATGLFGAALGLFGHNAKAAVFLQEEVHQVQAGETIQNVANQHGVTPDEIITVNGEGSFKEGGKILVPKVTDYTVTVDNLNVRLHPGTDSEVIGKVNSGDNVKVGFISEGWAGILVKGQVEFVKADYLTQKHSFTELSHTTTTNPAVEAKTPTHKMFVTTDNLRVRAKSNTNSAILGYLHENDSVSVISDDNDWAKISYNGKTAYVSDDFLANSKTTAEKSTQAAKTTTTNNQTVKTNTNTTTNSSSTVYVIQDGDYFTKIAKKLGVSPSKIEKLNPGVDSAHLTIGQKINVPVTSTSQTDVAKTTNTENNSKVYVVQDGDYFNKIAKKLDVSVFAIMDLNPGVDSAHLTIGQKINVPSSSVLTSTNQTKEEVGTIAGVDPDGNFRFFTDDKKEVAAKASGNLINELFDDEGKKEELTLKSDDKGHLTLVAIHDLQQ